MITCRLWNGSGIGNQLFNYVVTRVIALDKGVPFGIANHEKFKGSGLFTLDFGEEVIGGGSEPEGSSPYELPKGINNYYKEASFLFHGEDIRGKDHNLVNVPDNTLIDGYMQGECYFEHRKQEVKEWLKTEVYDLPDDLCVINFRGGEYLGVHSFFLSRKYWDDAIQNMKKINKDMKFHVVTDDIATAKQFFSNMPITHSMEDDYKMIHSAKYLIMSNSSFSWSPAWTSSQLKYCIAPKYYGRHNVSDGYWSLGYALTKGWMWQDRNGTLFTYEECKKEYEDYLKIHNLTIRT